MKAYVKSLIRDRWRLIAGVFICASAAAIAVGISISAAPDDSAEPVTLAYAGAVSGGDGRTTLDAVRLLVSEANKAGGINGHPVALSVHDDHDSADEAQDTAYNIAQRSSAVAVIGHGSSGASLSAAPVYARFGVPAIAPTATQDSLTASGWYFRTIYNNSQQARFIARYARFIIGRSDGVLVHSDDAYSTQLAEAVGRASVDVDIRMSKRWPLSSDDKAGDDKGAGAKAAGEVVEYLSGAGRGAVVFLMARAPQAREVLTAMRDHGLDNPVILPDGLGRAAFAASFADLPKERETPGFYTNGLFVAMPLIYDLSSGGALAFRDRFEQAYGYSPSWEAAFAYDAAALAVKAATVRKVGKSPSLRIDREAVKDYLAGLKSPELAFKGITGPIHFEGGGEPQRPIYMGMFQSRAVTPPAQLTHIGNPKAIRDIDARMKRGEIVRFEDEYLYRSTVVYTGLRPTGSWTIDPDNGRFTAEFDLWFRYQGDAPVTDIIFPTAVEPIVLGEPEKVQNLQGVKYLLYRVAGTFRLEGGEVALPFGRQQAAIRFRNRAATAERVLYVPDTLVLPKNGTELTKEFTRAGILAPGSGWGLTRAAVFSDSVPGEVRGEPEALDTSVEHFPFSTFTVSLDASETKTGIRRAVAFSAPGAVAGGLGVLLIGLIVVDCTLRRRRIVRVLMPLPLGAAALALLYVAEFGLVERWAASVPVTPLQTIKAVDVALWVLAAALVSALVTRLAWDRVARVTGRPVPLVFRLPVAAAIFAVAGLGAAATVFHQPVTGPAIGLGLAFALIGFALRQQVASLFAGIAIASERALAVGDSVRIGEHGGRVVEVGWRAIVLSTLDNRTISIPNTIVAASVIDRTVVQTGS